jgi:hypothetical protein
VDDRSPPTNTLPGSLEVKDKSVAEEWDAEAAGGWKILKSGKAVTVAWEQLHHELGARVKV